MLSLLKRALYKIMTSKCLIEVVRICKNDSTKNMCKNRFYINGYKRFIEVDKYCIILLSNK